MKRECYVVRDILPLYSEDMISKETAEYIEEHLDGCEECRTELETVKKTVSCTAETNTTPMKKIKKVITAKKIKAIVLTTILVLIAAVSVFAFLSAPEYLPYSEEAVSVMENADGSITVIFPEDAKNYRCTSVKYDGRTEYSLESWTSILERAVPTDGIKSVIINPQPGEGTIIRYLQNNGQEDVLLYSDFQEVSEGVITLPRLVLNYYIAFAALAVFILLILLIVFRKKEAVRLWLVRLILIPVSYIIGYLLTAGTGGITYSAQRDFALIMITAMLIYCGLLIAGSVIRQRKENREITK